MSPTQLAFGVGMGAAAGVSLLVLGTLVTGHEWWPPGDTTPACDCHWTLVAIFNGSSITTAVLSWGEWGQVGLVGLAGGCVLAGLGTALFVWAGRTMRSAETMRVTGDLYTAGPYAYTRNPQYLGMIVGVSGFAIVADSALVAALTATHVGWVLLLPRAEEPHLRAEFGEAYERYVARVPRFLGVRTVRRTLRSSDT